MSCATLQGIPKDCNGNLGGIVKAYFNVGNAIDEFTESDGVITAATLETGGLGEAGFVEFAFQPNTSNFTENTVIDLQTGSTFYEPTIELHLKRREAAKRQKLLLIAEGQPDLTIIVKDTNGTYWIFGLEDDKMYFTGQEGGSGVAKGDMNGYVLTFTQGEGGGTKNPAFEIEESVVEALIA